MFDKIDPKLEFRYWLVESDRSRKEQLNVNSSLTVTSMAGIFYARPGMTTVERVYEDFKNLAKLE